MQPRWSLRKQLAHLLVVEEGAQSLPSSLHAPAARRLFHVLLLPSSLLPAWHARVRCAPARSPNPLGALAVVVQL